MRMEVMKSYTARRSQQEGEQKHFAEVTVRAAPCFGPSEVVLSPAVLATLQEVFGPDFEHQRHNVRAAVLVQIDTANVAGDLPHVGAGSFRAEVIGLQVSGNAGRELSGFLLSVACMDAIAACLVEWEQVLKVRARLTGLA